MKEKIIKIKNIYNEFNISLYSGLIIGIAFTIYNIYLGISEKLIWNISFGIYYIFLTLAKLFTLKEYNKASKQNREYSFKNFILVSVLIILLTLAMIVPSWLMIKNKRSVNVGTIASITIATYTFTKLGVAIYNMIKYRLEFTLFNLSKVNIHINQALVSILTLQNTLIYTFETDTKNLLPLTIASSNLILIIMIILTIFTIKKGIKYHNSAKFSEI
jgi:hypothetical protein